MYWTKDVDSPEFFGGSNGDNDKVLYLVCVTVRNRSPTLPSQKFDLTDVALTLSLIYKSCRWRILVFHLHVVAFCVETSLVLIINILWYNWFVWGI